MVYRNGPMVYKSTNLPDKSATATDTYYNPNGSLNNTQQYVVPISHNVSAIVYTTKPKNQRFRSNGCRQQKFDFNTSLSAQSVFYVPLGGNATIESNTTHGHGSLATVLNAVETYYGSTGYSVLGAGGQGYINDAFARLKPDLTELSIPNFLIELKDIPGLFHIWSKNLSLLRNLANARLNWSFGWSPLVSDLKKIVSIIKSVRDKCIEWNKKAGDVFKRHTSTFPALVTSGSGSLNYGGGWTLYWKSNRTVKISAHMKFRTLKIPQLDEATTVLRVYLDALGFELNPSILWDALPFSFVLDWFFDVGGWMERHKYDTLELPVMLVDSCLQYKEELTISWYLENSSVSYVPRMRTQTFDIRRKTFDRLPIFPDQSAATAAGWKIPSTNQLINLFSLALTR